MKKILVLLTVVALFLLTACSGISGSKVKNTTEDFISYVGEGDFKKAHELIHIERETTADEIESYFGILEKGMDVDFSKKFQVIEYEYEDWEDEETTILGEYVKVTGTIETEDKKVIDFSLKLVKNDKDLGIYKIKFKEKE